MNYSRKNFLQLLGLGIGSSAIGIPAFSYENHSPLIKPERLQKGDTIGLISPAFTLPKETKYGKIEKKIRKQGFKVKVGAHAEDHFGYFAGTDKQRAADVNAMFTDESVDAIICFRGGWGCDRILKYLNFDTIAQNPKPFIGFSDITTLILAIYAKTGMITFHGPLGVSKFTPFTTKYFREALMDARPFTMKNKVTNQSNNGIKTIRKGRATGALLGGNLSVLTSMLGSGYLPSWEHSILFLEDVGEDIYRIDRMLTQLNLNGVFDKINGFVFGKCSHCSVSRGRHFTLGQILHQHLKNYDIPAFYGANIGHIDNIFTLPIGIKAQMDATEGTINVLESPVKNSR
jgi:muramoyltetrapeptide carboxypeptidase